MACSMAASLVGSRGAHSVVTTAASKVPHWAALKAFRRVAMWAVESLDKTTAVQTALSRAESKELLMAVC